MVPYIFMWCSAGWNVVNVTFCTTLCSWTKSFLFFHVATCVWPIVPVDNLSFKLPHSVFGVLTLPTRISHMLIRPNSRDFLMALPYSRDFLLTPPYSRDFLFTLFVVGFLTWFMSPGINTSRTLISVTAVMFTWLFLFAGSFTRPKSTWILRPCYPSPECWRWMTEDVPLLCSVIVLYSKPTQTTLVLAFSGVS